MRNLLLICFFLLAPLSASGTNATQQQARELFDADWQWRLERHSEFATSIGDHRFDATLTDTSLAASRADIGHQRQALEAARLLPRADLDPAAQLSLDLFIYEKELDLRAAAFYPAMAQPMTAYHGLHITLPELVAEMPFASEADYRTYLARLNTLPQHVAGLIEQLREGVKTGWVAPRDAVAALPARVRALREGALTGPLAQPFHQIPATIERPVREELASAGPAVLRNRVMPALLQLEDYLRSEYLPAARTSIGVASLPGGVDYYATLVAASTGSSLTPGEIHAQGKREVVRIRAAMDAAIARTGFTGSFTQFATFANSDKRLFYSSPEALLERYRRIVARANAGLPKLFLNPPAQELLVKPASGDALEARGAAWYDAGDATRPAAFVVNTTRLDTRPMWEMETLALHEALPGHHLQVAHARTLSALPAFRRYGWNPAYGEGWALYAESLGPELGFYRDAFSSFGHLNAELLRAARMVVDTGIHAFGWNRQQALDYLAANTANALTDNEVEVDRYIAFPAQALGYTVGAARIRALRQKAEVTLGERFDLRQFHAALLDQGPLPMALLEQQIDLWIAASGPLKSLPAPQG